MSMDPSDLYESDEWLSECCGARAYIGLHVEPDGRSATGVCSDCKEHASFTKDEDTDLWEQGRYDT